MKLAPPVIALLLTVLAACEQKPSPLLGKPLPAQTLLPGISHSDNLKIINLWASWCAPCQQEIPELQRLQDRFPAELYLVSFDLNQAVAERFLQQHRIQGTLIYDPQQSTLAALQLNGVPSTLLLAADNTVLAVFEGYQEDTVERLEKKLKELTAENAPGAEAQ